MEEVYISSSSLVPIKLLFSCWILQKSAISPCIHFLLAVSHTLVLFPLCIPQSFFGTGGHITSSCHYILLMHSLHLQVILDHDYIPIPLQGITFLSSHCMTLYLLLSSIPHIHPLHVSLHPFVCSNIQAFSDRGFLWYECDRQGSHGYMKCEFGMEYVSQF